MKAFPINSTDGENFYTNTGMDLRDYFAAKALQGLLANPDFDASLAVTIAYSCYEVADAMMEARNVTK